MEVSLLLLDYLHMFINAYKVLGKFEVLNQGRVELCDEKTVDFEITPNHAPYSTFVAYFVDESMKVEVAHFDIEIKNFYRNEVIK